MIRSLTSLFRKPSAEELAQRELDEAKRCLLESQRARDYHAKICEFYVTRINSLTKQLRDCNDTPPA